MEFDETTWVDTVPARPARQKRVTISEFEWTRTAAAEGEPTRLTACFFLNTTELMAVLLKDIASGQVDNPEAIAALRPRTRIGGRTYLLTVEAPASNSTG